MRSGYKMLPAHCHACGATGPQKNVARRDGWRTRGPQQARRWYCPRCELPPLPTPCPAAVPQRPPCAPDTRHDDPFAALRAERDAEARQEAAAAQQSAEVTSPFWLALYGLDER